MPEIDDKSLNAGQKLAEQTLEKAKAKIRARPASWSNMVQAAGVILVEGDSWFDYPADDIPYVLEQDYGYDVGKVSTRGDTLMSIAYDEYQIRALLIKLQKMKKQNRVPKAILLSAGGNDVAGKEFAGFLNPKVSGLPALNDTVFDTFLQQKARPAYISWCKAVNAICVDVLGSTVPIILHGYDYVIPDGRGYNIGINISGPWLKPGFFENGHTDLAANKKVMQVLINKLNALLANLRTVGGLENVVYLDLRGTIPTGADYKKWWANELHPSDEGFALVAAKFHAAVQALP